MPTWSKRDTVNNCHNIFYFCEFRFSKIFAEIHKWIQIIITLKCSCRIKFVISYMWQDMVMPFTLTSPPPPTWTRHLPPDLWSLHTTPRLLTSCLPPPYPLSHPPGTGSRPALLHPWPRHRFLPCPRLSPRGRPGLLLATPPPPACHVDSHNKWAGQHSLTSTQCCVDVEPTLNRHWVKIKKLLVTHLTSTQIMVTLLTL